MGDVRRYEYIYMYRFPHITYPYYTCIGSFYSIKPTSLFILKMFFSYVQCSLEMWLTIARFSKRTLKIYNYISMYYIGNTA